MRVTRSEFLLILLFQLVVEALYFLLGVRMDVYPLIGYWQLIDPVLLKTDLLRSIFYLHIQPPGFNLFVGLVLKAFPATYPFVFQFLYFVLGVLALWSVFSLQVRFGVSRGLALATTLLFGASPGYILFEHHLLYTFPVAALWITSALVLRNYFTSRRFGWLLVFFGILWILAWTRAIVHVVYVIAVVGMVLWRTRPVRLRQVAAAGVLLALVLAPYVKNYVVFGKFTQSTWFPGNLAKVVIFPVSYKKRLELYHHGKISKYSAHIWQPDPEKKDKDEAYRTHEDERGNPYWNSPGFLKPYLGLPRVPVLFDRFKSTHTGKSAYPNINYVGMIGTYEQVMKDDIKLALDYPNIVLTSWCYSFLIYTMPSYIQAYISANNTTAAQPVIHVYERLYGKVPAGFLHHVARWLEKNWDYVPFFNPKNIYLVLMLGIPLLLYYGMRRYRRSSDPVERPVLLYILGTVLFVMLVGNLADCGENNRFRFLTDFMYVFLSGLALQGLAAALGRMRSRRGVGRK